MNKIDYILYKNQFDELYKQLPFEVRDSRMMIINALRPEMDLWCRQYYHTVYTLKEECVFKRDMTACFNKALNEVIKERTVDVFSPECIINI